MASSMQQSLHWVYRACLDQHLITIRSGGIRRDHLRSGTSLIAITRLRRFSLSTRLLYELGLAGHFETVINCTVLHATWRAGWEMSQHQQPVVHCGGDPGVSECTVQQWIVVEKTNSGVSYYQTDCSGCHARPWPYATSAAKWLHAVLHWMFNCYSLGGPSDIITDRDQLL